MLPSPLHATPATQDDDDQGQQRRIIIVGGPGAQVYPSPQRAGFYPMQQPSQPMGGGYPGSSYAPPSAYGTPAVGYPTGPAPPPPPQVYEMQAYVSAPPGPSSGAAQERK